MSFIGKAVKKIFKVAKKIVKSKWFKIALIAAACVFTAGIAAGGFAAFSGVSTIGGFFGAVGSTMSAGMSAIAGGLGLSAAAPTGAMVGTTANTAGVLMAGAGAPLTGSAAGGALGGALGSSSLLAGGATALTESALAGVGLGGSALTGISAVAPAAAGWSVATAGTGVGQVAGPAAGGWLSKFGNLLMDKGVAGTAMRQGIMGGISWASQAAAAKKEDKYRRSAYVWGNQAFGGDGSGIEMPTLKSSTEGGVFDQQDQMAQAPRQVKNRPLEGSEAPQLASLLTPNQQMAQQDRPLTAEQSASVGQQAPGQFVPQNLGVA